DASVMVIQITSATGTLPVASLFTGDSERTRNSARRAVHAWNLHPARGTQPRNPGEGAGRRAAGRTNAAPRGRA
ncbi:MAG: hypothetical protein AB1384_06755, partial [Actinomycetota bacterium]